VVVRRGETGRGTPAATLGVVRVRRKGHCRGTRRVDRYPDRAPHRAPYAARR
jgi:hypothetical protein